MLTAASQASSAAGLLLLRLSGARTSDVYAIALPVGSAGLVGVVLGVLYGYVLGRPQFVHWNVAKLAAAIFTVLGAVAVSSAVQRALGDAVTVNFLVAIMAVGGIGLASAGVEAVRLACLGKASLLAAVAVPTNLALLVGAIALLAVPRTPVLLPALLWAATGAAQSFDHWRRGRRVSPDAEMLAVQGSESRANMVLHIAALLVGAVTTAIFPSFYSSAIAQLQAGTSGTLYILNRIGTSAVALGVNSLLMVRFNWRSIGVSLHRPVTLLTAGAVLVGVVGLPLPDGGLLISTGVVFVLLICAAPLMLRELNLRRRGGVLLAKAVIDVAISVGSIAILFACPSASGYFAAYSLSQAVTITVAAIANRHTLLSVTSGLAILVSLSELLLPSLR